MLSHEPVSLLLTLFPITLFTKWSSRRRRRLRSQMWSRLCSAIWLILKAFHLNSCLHSHFVTHKVGMRGERQQCATREEKSHSSYAPNVAVLLIRQSQIMCCGMPSWGAVTISGPGMRGDPSLVMWLVKRIESWNGVMASLPTRPGQTSRSIRWRWRSPQAGPSFCAFLC